MDVRLVTEAHGHPELTRMAQTILNEIPGVALYHGLVARGAAVTVPFVEVAGQKFFGLNGIREFVNTELAERSQAERARVAADKARLKRFQEAKFSIKEEAEEPLTQ